MATDVPPLKYEELAAARCVLKQRNNVVIRYPKKSQKIQENQDGRPPHWNMKN